MISCSSPSIYQNDHKIFNKHHLAAVPDGFEKKGHDHNHCCFHCHLMISVFKKTSWWPKFRSPYQSSHLEKWTVWWSSRMNGFSIRLTFKMSEISVMAEEWIQYLYSWTLSLTDVQLIKDIKFCNCIQQSLRDEWRYQIRWIFGNSSKGRVIFSTKIHIANFGPFWRALRRVFWEKNL